MSPEQSYPLKRVIFNENAFWKLTLIIEIVKEHCHRGKIKIRTNAGNNFALRVVFESNLAKKKKQKKERKSKEAYIKVRPTVLL